MRSDICLYLLECEIYIYGLASGPSEVSPGSGVPHKAGAVPGAAAASAVSGSLISGTGTLPRGETLHDVPRVLPSPRGRQGVHRVGGAVPPEHQRGCVFQTSFPSPKAVYKHLYGYLQTDSSFFPLGTERPPQLAEPLLPLNSAPSPPVSTYWCTLAIPGRVGQAGALSSPGLSSEVNDVTSERGMRGGSRCGEERQLCSSEQTQREADR